MRLSTVLVGLELVVGSALDRRMLTQVSKKIVWCGFLTQVLFLRHWAQISDTSEASFQLEIWHVLWMSVLVSLFDVHHGDTRCCIGRVPKSFRTCRFSSQVGPLFTSLALCSWLGLLKSEPMANKTALLLRMNREDSRKDWVHTVCLEVAKHSDWQVAAMDCLGNHPQNHPVVQAKQQEWTAVPLCSMVASEIHESY